jgi:hypothetical protein
MSLPVTFSPLHFLDFSYNESSTEFSFLLFDLRSLQIRRAAITITGRFEWQNLSALRTTYAANGTENVKIYKGFIIAQ